jgi:hypothetical protein
MQKTALYAIAGLLMISASLLANHTLHRTPEKQVPPISLDRLPRVIGEWKAEQEDGAQEGIQERIHTSSTLIRSYRRGSGPRIELLLAVSTSQEALSDPRNSLPPGNWRILERKERALSGQQFTEVTADNLFQQYRVLYRVQPLNHEKDRTGVIENLQLLHDRMQNKKRRTRWLLIHARVPALHRQAEEVYRFWERLSHDVQSLVDSGY